MGRKRKKLSKIHGFQKDNSPWNKGKNYNFSKTTEEKTVQRFTENTFNRRVTNHNGVLSVHNVDGAQVDTCILRPRPNSPDVVDMYLQDASNMRSTSRHTSNKLYNQSHIESLFNSEMKNHVKYKPECNGDLIFDVENEKQWGVSWRERLICSDCDFTSEYHKIYDVVESNKRGPKASTMNLQTQIGLMTSPISGKNFREILMASNVPPPSASGMQKTANKVSKMVVDINQKDMQDIRQKLVLENQECGIANDNLVRVESDARYNNPIIKSGTTPFQAGTQVVSTMSENNTNDKQIISVFTGNKLCSVAARLRNKGLEIICPNHEGVCTANIAQDSSIGNEAAYSKACANEIKDCLKISHFTSDGDSKSLQGVKNVHGPSVMALRDVRHLAGSMKRSIMKHNFSPNLFRGANKGGQKSRFALDIKARCVAELNQCYKAHNGQLYKIKEQMPKVIKTIIMCYKGYCGASCKQDSYVCGGLPSQHWHKNFIPYGETCKMSDSDEKKLEGCINILLGPKSLDLVRFLTSTQKSEAFNRTLSRCNPKNVTFARNFPGRVHTAVHMRNHRHANSILMLTEKLGAPIKSLSVLKKLKQSDKKDKYLQKYRQSSAFKKNRAINRNRRYKLHASIHFPRPIYYEKGLSDPKYHKPCTSLCGSSHDHSYERRLSCKRF